MSREQRLNMIAGILGIIGGTAGLAAGFIEWQLGEGWMRPGFFGGIFFVMLGISLLQKSRKTS